MATDENTPLPADAEEYKTLCRLARKIQQLQPSKFFSETDLFGVQVPESEELLFVSVMSTGLVMVRGVEGLYAWREFHDALGEEPPHNDPVILFRSVALLQLDFDSDDFLTDHDQEVLKSSGVRFSLQVPQFRSQHPGCYPWFLTREEARQMIHALEQTIEVVKQHGDDPGMLRLNHQPGNHHYLVRIQLVYEGKATWRDAIRWIDPAPTQLIPFAVDASVLDQLKALRSSDPQDIDLMVLPAKLGDPNERQRVLFCYLVANSITGYLFAFESLDAPNGVDLMYAELGELLAATWLEHELTPVEVRVRSKKLHDALRGLTEGLMIKLTLADELPAINEARSMIENNFGRERRGVME